MQNVYNFAVQHNLYYLNTNKSWLKMKTDMFRPVSSIHLQAVTQKILIYNIVSENTKSRWRDY